MSGGPVRSQGGGVENRVAELERRLSAGPYLTKVDNLADLASIPAARGILFPAGTLVNSQLADMAQATVKGRASGAGTGAPVDLSAAQLATLIGFTQSLIANGYQKLPNGLIIQWGVTSGTGGYAVTLPTTFPSACRSVVSSMIYPSAPSNVMLSAMVDSFTTSSFVIRKRYWVAGAVGDASQDASWFAIGH